MLPVTHGPEFTRLQVLLYTLVLFAATLLPFVQGMSGLPYLVSAVGLSGWFVVLSWRLWRRYVVQDFHPLVFFYAIGSLLLTVGTALGVFVVVRRLTGHDLTSATVVLIALLVLSGLQLVLFAMWFDMDAGSRRRP